MDLITRKVDNVFVINIDGEIDNSTSTLFKKSLCYALDRGERNIILNFNRVHFITSVGIGAMVDLYKRLERIEGRLILVEVGRLVRDVLAVSHLDKVFQIMESEDEALRKLSGN